MSLYSRVNLEIAMMRVNHIKNVLPANVSSSVNRFFKSVALNVHDSVNRKEERERASRNRKERHHLPRLPRFAIDIPMSVKTTNAQATDAIVFVNSILNFISSLFSLLCQSSCG
jgi:hypothetical protein